MRLQVDEGPALLRRNPRQAVRSRASGLPRAALISAALAAAGVLAGCSSTPDQRACPRVQVIGDLGRLVQFAPGAARNPGDVAYVASIDSVRSHCVYDAGGVTVDMTVALGAERGPAGTRLPDVDVTYFVAITDPSRSIIAKQPFTSRIAFSGPRGASSEDLEQRIPVGAHASAGDYAIILGFQLTPEQVDFNEKHPGG